MLGDVWETPPGSGDGVQLWDKAKCWGEAETHMYAPQQAEAFDTQPQQPKELMSDSIKTAAERVSSDACMD